MAERKNSSTETKNVLSMPGYRNQELYFDVGLNECGGQFTEIISALDKLLGRMGIYATWLSSIEYLQKQLCIFIFFYATFFSVITRFLIA